MATLPEELFERIGGTTGVGIGIAALLLAPRVARPLGRSLRALAKGAIKGYLVISSRARTAVNEAADEWLHVYQEARSEANGEAASRNGRLVESARGGGGLEELTVDDRRPTTDDQRPTTRRRGDGVVPPPTTGGGAGGRRGDRHLEPGAGSREPRARREATSDRINLNEADHDALVRLPGVGERTAEKILQYRAEHGRIGSLEELREAAILFAATVERLRGLVTV